MIMIIINKKTVPGLALTMGMVELATGHIISGICRLVSALTTQFQIAYAITLGLTFCSVLFPPLLPCLFLLIYLLFVLFFFICVIYFYF